MHRRSNAAVRPSNRPSRSPRRSTAPTPSGYNDTPMAAPTTIPRPEHILSRRQIDDDALKVISRLQQHDYETYLVGGGVRDLLLERRPKDFDIGTSAHPQQIKALFRNCWIIGRRFRLAHVRFGDKTIEVATFRKQVPPETDTERKAREEARERARREAEAKGVRPRRLIRGDNTFGTAEEDAFRRDFTVNGLFYDASSRTILDYVDGMRDIRSRTLRSIGDPNERFVEDPVRMLRAVVLAARLDLSIDPQVTAAIRRHHGELTHSSPARLIEELYKIARSGSAERIVHDLGSIGLLKHFAPELDKARSDALWRSLAALDRYRRQFDDAPTDARQRPAAGEPRVPLLAPRTPAPARRRRSGRPTPPRGLSRPAAHRAPGPGAAAAGARPATPPHRRAPVAEGPTRGDAPVRVPARAHVDDDSRTDAGHRPALAIRRRRPRRCLRRGAPPPPAPKTPPAPPPGRRPAGARERRSERVAGASGPRNPRPPRCHWAARFPPRRPVPRRAPYVGALRARGSHRRFGEVPAQRLTSSPLHRTGSGDRSTPMNGRTRAAPRRRFTGQASGTGPRRRDSGRTPGQMNASRTRAAASGEAST